VVREGPYPVDPWVVGIVEVEVEGLASGLQMGYSLELEIDLGLGRETVLDLGLAMALGQVRGIDHAEQKVATLSACPLLEDGSLPRSMQSPGAGRSLTWFDDPRRFGELRSPLRNVVPGYLESL
jgi:hypothetical protein